MDNVVPRVAGYRCLSCLRLSNPGLVNFAHQSCRECTTEIDWSAGTACLHDLPGFYRLLTDSVSAKRLDPYPKLCLISNGSAGNFALLCIRISAFRPLAHSRRSFATDLPKYYNVEDPGYRPFFSVFLDIAHSLPLANLHRHQS